MLRSTLQPAIGYERDIKTVLLGKQLKSPVARVGLISFNLRSGIEFITYHLSVHMLLLSLPLKINF